jgi:hypothetical protein
MAGQQRLVWFDETWKERIVAFWREVDADPFPFTIEIEPDLFSEDLGNLPADSPAEEQVNLGYLKGDRIVACLSGLVGSTAQVYVASVQDYRSLELEIDLIQEVMRERPALIYKITAQEEAKELQDWFHANGFHHVPRLRLWVRGRSH